MNTYAHIHSGLDTHFNGRMLRATLGVGLAATFLSGMWVTPAWVFTAAVLAIYLVTSAILDKSLLDMVFRAHGHEAAVQPAYDRARMTVGRLARGATAGVAMGSVLGDAVIDAYVLDALDIFLLNAGGVFLAMTTLVRGASTSEKTGTSTAGSIPGTDQVAEPEFGSTKRAA